MHKIDKFLARLDADRRQKVLAVVERIKNRNFSGLNIRKLQGSTETYRIRVGRIRIKFVINESDVHIFSIDNRGDNTYRDI